MNNFEWQVEQLFDNVLEKLYDKCMSDDLNAMKLFFSLFDEHTRRAHLFPETDSTSGVIILPEIMIRGSKEDPTNEV